MRRRQPVASLWPPLPWWIARKRVAKPISGRACPIILRYLPVSIFQRSANPRAGIRRHPSGAPPGFLPSSGGFAAADPFGRRSRGPPRSRSAPLLRARSAPAVAPWARHRRAWPVMRLVETRTSHGNRAEDAFVMDRVLVREDEPVIEAHSLAPRSGRPRAGVRSRTAGHSHAGISRPMID